MTMTSEYACPHCGQFVAIYITPEMTKEEKEDLAARKCMCEQAIRAREIAEA